MRDRTKRTTAALRALAIAAAAAASGAAAAGGGPLGIDHPVNFDDSGIWKRRNQIVLQDATALLVVGGALWEGDDSRFGHTLWQSVDAMAIGVTASTVMKRAFGRTRPAETNDPNRWFRGSHNNSFPSGEVMEITTAVTPLILEYGAEYPAVWALGLLPVYDAVARVKVKAHWQSDVVASLAIGTAIGVWTHSRSSSLSVGVLPRGVTIGWKKSF